MTFFASISFGPYWSRRVVASALVRPFGEEARRFSTSARGRVFRSSFVPGSDPGFSPGPLDGGPSDFALAMSRSFVWHMPDDSDATSPHGHSPRDGTTTVHQPARSWSKDGGYVMSLVYAIISV